MAKKKNLNNPTMQWSTFVNIITVSDDVSVRNLKSLATIVRTVSVHNKGSSKWGSDVRHGNRLVGRQQLAAQCKSHRHKLD